MLHDTEITQLRDRWAVEAAPDDLADRIVRHALAQKQHRPFLVRVRDALAMPEPTNAWKGGFAVAACLVIAIAINMQPASPTKVVYKKPIDQLVEEMYWEY